MFSGTRKMVDLIWNQEEKQKQMFFLNLHVESYYQREKKIFIAQLQLQVYASQTF